MDYQAVRTDRSKYIHWMQYPDDKLYDLESDTYETTNLANEPASRAIRERLREELRRLQL